MAKRGKPGRVPDGHLWSAVTRTVTPLRPRRPLAEPPAPLPAPLADNKPRPVPSLPSAGPVIAAAAPKDRGIEPGLRKRLERGRLPIDATLDLHGLTQEEAYRALRKFLPARARRGDRTVLVITGKGLRRTGPHEIESRGILRAMLPIWLADPALSPLVAGISGAHATHGGGGAFYVRLRGEGGR